MSYNFLNFKLEDTIKNFIKSNDGPDCDVWTFGELVTRGEELAEPWIGVRCMTSNQGSADVQLDTCPNDRYFTAEIAVRTHAEDEYDTGDTTILRTARQVHADLCGQLLDIFFTSTVLTDLNNAAGVVGGIQISQIDQPTINTSVEGRSFVTLASFNILCNSAA